MAISIAHPSPVANPSSNSTFLQSDVQSFRFVNLHNEPGWGRGVHISAVKNFHCIFRHLLKNKGCFVGACFFESASVIPIRLPSVQAYGSPRAKPQEMRYWYDPREVRKGHLFHRCRWQNSRGKPRGQGKFERRRAHEEMRYETSKKAGACFVCGLLIAQAKAHTASHTTVFSKNTSSGDSCCAKKFDPSSSSLFWIYLEGILNGAMLSIAVGEVCSPSHPTPSPPTFTPKCSKLTQLVFNFDMCCAAEVHSLTKRQQSGRPRRWETWQACTIAYYNNVTLWVHVQSVHLFHFRVMIWHNCASRLVEAKRPIRPGFCAGLCLLWLFWLDR